jgi:hypothetical protein
MKVRSKREPFEEYDAFYVQQYDDVQKMWEMGQNLQAFINGNLEADYGKDCYTILMSVASSDRIGVTSKNDRTLNNLFFDSFIIYIRNSELSMIPSTIHQHSILPKTRIGAWYDIIEDK